MDFPNGVQNKSMTAHVCISIHNTCVWVCSVLSSSLQPHELQHTRLVCPWDFPQQEY